MSEQLTLQDRRTIVIDVLRPDDVHNHRVADGLELTEELEVDLDAKATLLGAFSDGMGSLSQAALEAPSGDRLMRTVRTMLGTEAMHQARIRGEISTVALPPARIIKADLILTGDGLRTVEIEPGKIRGLGYAQLVRHQARTPIGIGAERALSELTEGRPTLLLMSEGDKFHEPEMRALGRIATNLALAPQRSLSEDRAGSLTLRGEAVGGRQAIMMSPFHDHLGASEPHAREQLEVISDRRLDLESKGALALLHNFGQSEELEALLLRHFDVQILQQLREAIPVTIHAMLLSEAQREDLRSAIAEGSASVFVKPLSNSGTRGIVTPDRTDEILSILASGKHSRSVVFQIAHEGIRMPMDSVDVLSGSTHHDDMNLRITIHTDGAGQLIDASVVGSPHDYLAHGGKRSVITNLEAPRHG